MRQNETGKMRAHDILRTAIDILRLGWSQGASARNAGETLVPLFTGDVGAVNPAAAKWPMARS
jgi:hypothetical protein